MRFDLLHPADQLVLIMERIYQGGMTTTSGGNLSVLDDNGDIWITPAGIDKGTLTARDMCRVTPDGKVYGQHKPSVELPFHATIYKRRRDLRAVLHAHPPALVAFSLARVLPNTRLVANVSHLLDKMSMAAYAVPGSQGLGDNIAAEFEKGIDLVMLENHGVVVGAEDMLRAFMKFETLESAARLEINARKLGTPRYLYEGEINLAATREYLTMGRFALNRHSAEECETRREMVKIIHRAYSQQLFGSAQGTCSARLSDGSFIITPYGVDRAYMEEQDLVLVKNGLSEEGKEPSRSVILHQKIYEKCPDIRAILGATPPHAMAFAVTDASFDPRTIPESYIMLRQIEKVPFSAAYLQPNEVAGLFSPKTPVLICENNQLLATGNSLINAFDRLEVAEATARSILMAQSVGALVHISEEEVEAINEAFNLS